MPAGKPKLQGVPHSTCSADGPVYGPDDGIGFSNSPERAKSEPTMRQGEGVKYRSLNRSNHRAGIGSTSLKRQRRAFVGQFRLVLQDRARSANT